MDGKANLDTPNIDHKDLKPGWYWAHRVNLPDNVPTPECLVDVMTHGVVWYSSSSFKYDHWEFICRIPSAAELEKVDLAIATFLRKRNGSILMGLREALKLLRGEE